MTESQLVNQICEGLLYRGIFCWRSNNIPIFSQKQNCFRKLPKFTPRGVADILGILTFKLKNDIIIGMMLCIEVKVAKNKLSIYQQIFLDKINKKRGIGFVAYSWEDVENKLIEIEKSYGKILYNLQ